MDSIIVFLVLLLAGCQVSTPGFVPTLNQPAAIGEGKNLVSTSPAVTASPSIIPVPPKNNTATTAPTLAALPSFTPPSSPPLCAALDSNQPSIYLDENRAVKLRLGPGCEYPSFSQALKKQDPLSFFFVTGKMGDWWQVDMCSDAPLWVFAPSIGNNLRGEAGTIPVITNLPPEPPLSATATLLSGPPALDAASSTLVQFFEHLQAGKYDQADRLFDGGYGIVRMWNEDVDPLDTPTLLMRGCEWNGFLCSVRVRQVLEVEALSIKEYRGTVNFKNQDGSLFGLHNLADLTAPPLSLSPSSRIVMVYSS